MAKILIVSGNLKDWTKNSGGKERTATLAEALSNHNITFLSFSIDGPAFEGRINDYIYEIRPSIEPNVVREYKRLVSDSVKVNHDAAVYILKDHFKIFRNKLKDLASKSDLVILDHPSVSGLIDDLEDIPIIYNSHNCEITMANQLYPDKIDIIDIVEKMEKIALDKSIATTYCSKKDFAELKEYYGYDKKDLYVPNGTIMQEKISYKIRFGSKTILFVGSGHPPNIAAAKKLIPVAQLLPQYNFVICGGASNALNKETLPSNIYPMGHVSDEDLHSLFQNSFAFINPMEFGSGTHLKMMKALSYGIPIITSAIGARGFTEDEIKNSMLITEKPGDIFQAVTILENENNYKLYSENGYEISKNYNWEKIKKIYSNWVDDILEKIQSKKLIISKQKETVAISNNKEKILIYSIIRNRKDFISRYYNQLINIVKNCPEYEFFLSIYENDSDDGTKEELYSKNWSMFSGVSIITENINTKYFTSVKDGERTENLAKARNKAIEAGGFLDKVDYVLMVEGDVRYDISSIKKILEFKNKESKFDIVSAISLRKNGQHYDWWATRTSAVYKPGESEIEPNYKKKEYGRYYSTSNGICLYRAKPFQEGIRHHWINTVTKEADCEMVVLCQNFQEAGYKNIYILYAAEAHHI